MFTEVVKDMIERYKELQLINTKNTRSGLTALHTLLEVPRAENELTPLIEHFITCPGINLDITAGCEQIERGGGTTTQDTAAHYAIKAFNNKALQTLINNKASLSIKDRDARTAIDCAIKQYYDTESRSTNVNYKALEIILTAPQQKVNARYIEAAEIWLINYRIENANEFSTSETFKNIFKKITPKIKQDTDETSASFGARLTKLEALNKSFKSCVTQMDSIRTAAQFNLITSYNAGWVFDLVQNADFPSDEVVAKLNKNVAFEILGDHSSGKKIKNLWSKKPDECDEEIKSKILQIRLLIDQFRNIENFTKTICEAEKRTTPNQEAFLSNIGTAIKKLSEMQQEIAKKPEVKSGRESSASLTRSPSMRPSPSVLGDLFGAKRSSTSSTLRRSLTSRLPRRTTSGSIATNTLENDDEFKTPTGRFNYNPAFATTTSLTPVVEVVENATTPGPSPATSTKLTQTLSTTVKSAQGRSD